MLTARPSLTLRRTTYFHQPDAVSKNGYLLRLPVQSFQLPMNKRIRTNDILIGEARWIESIELKGGHNDAVEIDPLLVGLSSLWALLEVHCVAGCCGLEAFDFFPESIASASKKMDLVDLNSSLNNAIQDIEGLSTELVRSTRLNNLADKKMFLALLHHIRSCVPAVY